MGTITKRIRKIYRILMNKSCNTQDIVAKYIYHSISGWKELRMGESALLQKDKDNINYRFKFLYAIGMIAIVAGHCSGGGMSLMYDWFKPYSFHLGLFVFSSGYFYSISHEDNVGKYIVKKVRKLLVPLYLWNLFYGILTFLLHRLGFTFGGKFNISNLLIAPITSGHQFMLNLGGWFVIPLFMLHVYFILIRKLIGLLGIKLNEYAFFIFNLLLGILAIYMSRMGLNTGWWLVLDRFLFFVPFYSLGTLYKLKLEKFDKHINTFLYFTVVMLAQLLIITFVGECPTYAYSWMLGFDDSFIIPYLVGFLGIAFWLRVAAVIEPVTKSSKLVNIIADNSYSIMINQLLGFLTLRSVFAVANKALGLCEGFNFEDFYNDIWYCYLPRKINNWLFIYLIAGIVIPIAMQMAVNLFKNKIMRKDADK